MASHAPDPSAVVLAQPRAIPGTVKTGAIVGILIGLAAAGYGLATHKDLAFAGFVSNFMFWAGIAQGGMMLAVAMTLVGARWGRPLKRYAEALGVAFPVMYVLLLVFFLVGGLDIYPWMHEEMPAHKSIYLQPGFLVMRQVVGLGLLSVLSLLFVRNSLRADIGRLAPLLGDKAPKLWSRFTANWAGEEAEAEACMKRQTTLSAVIALLFAATFAVMSVDLSMSLAPHWYANMFPAWYSASAFWSGLVGIAILSLATRKWLGLDQWVTPKVYHDLGKLTFGFTMFWGYTAFAQYLAIWYGNMTEEIGFILLRTELQPWENLYYVVVSLCFVVPFTTLLSRGLKKIPSALFAITTLLAIGIFLERFWVVMPSVQMEPDLWTPLLITAGMGVGFLGLFALITTWYLTNVPALPVADPFLGPDPRPEFVHVHPASEHAH